MPAIGPDLDHDGDVDGDDVTLFKVCVSGPAIPYVGLCGDRDFDTDNDVDLSDFAGLQRCMRGADVPADPGCLD